MMFSFLGLSGDYNLLLINRFGAGFLFGIYPSAFTVYNREMSPPGMVSSGGAITETIFGVGIFIPAFLSLNLGAVDDPKSA